MSEWYGDLPERKKVTYGLLFTIIFMTVPCYVLGFIALAMAPPRFTPTPTETATYTPTSTATHTPTHTAT
ncbi:MAG TPA: hypothetical protein VMW79_02095, partial [Anaerolineae bacterium]|nr:hypothetical protein [Anaerolineae bacterium]